MMELIVKNHHCVVCAVEAIKKEGLLVSTGSNESVAQRWCFNWVVVCVVTVWMFHYWRQAVGSCIKRCSK